MSRHKRRARKEARDAGFVFEAPRRGRMSRYFRGMSVEGLERWWLDDYQVWVAEFRGDPRWEAQGHASSMAPCRTLRSFRSHLRRHAQELAGCKVILHSGYVGFNVTVQL